MHVQDRATVKMLPQIIKIAASNHFLRGRWYLETGIRSSAAPPPVRVRGKDSSRLATFRPNGGRDLPNHRVRTRSLPVVCLGSRWIATRILRTKALFFLEHFGSA